MSKYNFLPEEDIEEKRRRLTPFLFAINYELELIADESLLFQEPRWGRFNNEIWRKEKVYAHIDAAYGGGDTCALTVMGGNHAAGWTHEGNVTGWYDFIKQKYDYYHCSEILLETNSDKGFLANELRRLGFTARPYSENMNKAIKISTYLYEAWRDLIWDDDTSPDYMNQILDWREDGAGHDDAPDSAASLIRAMFAKKDNALSEKTRAALFG